MDYLEEDFNQVWDFDIESFLEETRQGEKQRIEHELERIDKQLEERDRIHEEALSELESKLDWYKSRLQKLYKLSGKRERQDEVKNQIQRFYRLIREERHSVWKDRQRLERRRSEKIRELSELDDSTLSELIEGF